MRLKKGIMLLTAVLAILAPVSFYTYAQFRTTFEPRQMDVRSLGDDEIYTVQSAAVSTFGGSSMFGLNIHLHINAGVGGLSLQYKVKNTSGSGSTTTLSQGENTVYAQWGDNDAKEFFKKNEIGISTEVLGGYVSRNVIVDNPYHIGPQADWETARAKVAAYMQSVGGFSDESEFNKAVENILKELNFKKPKPTQSPTPSPSPIPMPIPSPSPTLTDDQSPGGQDGNGN